MHQPDTQTVCEVTGLLIQFLIKHSYTDRVQRGSSVISTDDDSTQGRDIKELVLSNGKEVSYERQFVFHIFNYLLICCLFAVFLICFHILLMYVLLSL